MTSRPGPMSVSAQISTVAATTAAVALLASGAAAQEVSPFARAPVEARPGPFVATFFQEPALPFPEDARPKKPLPRKNIRAKPADGLVGAAMYLRPYFEWTNPRPRRGNRAPFGGGGGGADAPDVMVADGSETSLAIDVGNPNKIVATVNGYFFNSPSTLVSSNGNGSWASRSFPTGGSSYNGYPFDPWANSGNAAGELFVTLIRRDSLGSENTRCVIARSTNGGESFSLFYAATNRIAFQDREMVDVDLTTAMGGGAGTSHDGKVYLCFDDYGPNGSAFPTSVLQIIAADGGSMSELVVSNLANFRGSQIQPAAGVVDGRVFLLSNSSSGGGSNSILNFHMVTNGVAAFNRSNLQFPATGRQLAGSGRWGLNGYRIDTGGFMDLDRTNGPRRGRIYVVSSRNPNTSNASLDQGDVYISYSTNDAQTWSTAAIPGAAPGKTQFFPMMDVDDNGYIHVGYYQNEDGVLNASTVNLYYTYSTDGGSTWATHAQINSAANALDLQNPPPNLSGVSFYLVGDYAQLKATGTGPGTTVYVLWSTYDKDRSNSGAGNARERVICTTIPPGAVTGACCIAGACTANVTEATCTGQGGTFFAGQTCASVSCPLPNNNCANAILIGAGSRPFSNLGATTDGPGTCPVNQDIWYRFTTVCGGEATAQVSSGAFIPAVAVYSGASCPPGPQVACGTDGTGQVTFQVQPNSTYTLRVGGIGGGSGSGTLTLFLPVGTAPPQITQHPTAQTVCLGGTASFSVTATGSSPLSYQWRRNAVNIPGANSSTITITNAQGFNAGAYTCAVSNSCGTAISNGAGLTVSSGPPVITQHPVPALAAGPGQTVNLSVSATGAGLAYQWQRNGQNVVDGGSVSGSNSPTLSINPVDPLLHDGTYRVVVSSTCGGDVTSNTTLLCYANCDRSTTSEPLNIYDFVCFVQRFTANDPFANCDASTGAPLLTVGDFSCFLQRFSAGCP